jgi:riboflavin transporter FmnP
MKKLNVRKLVLLSLISALAYAIVLAFPRIEVAGFLRYEPKDVIIVIGGFLLGPGATVITSLLVALLEMVTISDTGPIGCLMNALSTRSFALTAALIYKKKHDLNGAVLSLVTGSILMAGVMVLWNWIVTPLYMEVPRPVVESMLLPVFLPFNLVKAGLNSALVLALYKPLTAALRSARLLPPTEAGKKGSAKPGIYIFAAALLATCILLLLALQGKI